MILLVITLAALAIGVLMVRREPRRLINGIVLLGGLAAAGLSAITLIAALDDDPYHRLSGLALLGLLGLLVGFTALLSLACVYYGVVVLRRERTSLANLLALVAGLGVLTYLALAVAAVTGSRAGPVALVLASLLPLGYLGFAFTAFVGYSWLYSRLARRAPAPAAVVVLGSGLAGDRVTPLLAARLRLGIEVYERGRAAGADTVLVASGGQGPNELVAEGRAMADWLIAEGVAAEHVLVEDRSRSTRENLLLSHALLDKAGVDGPVTAVTNNYHAFRAASLMRRLGIAGQAVGAPTARYFWPSAILREYVAMLREHLRLNAALLVVLSVPLLTVVVLRAAMLLGISAGPGA